MKFEDQYFDVLRGIELAIHNSDKQVSDLADFNVEKVLDGLLRLYVAEERGKRQPKLKLTSNENTLLDNVNQICELHLGRDPDVPVDQTVDVSEVIACLKRIKRSVNQMGGRGRRGYLEFLNEFFNA